MADYEWSYETSIDGAGEVSAEEWLRATWEDGPPFWRAALPLAWKYGLGLRLGSTADATRVLGWHIADTSRTLVTVDASSRILRAENAVSIDRGSLRWRTAVTYENVAGRLLWMPARLVHQWLVPRSLRRAVRRRDDRRAT